MKQSMASRIAGFTLSGAIHVALGLLLLNSIREGVPPHRPAQGNAGHALIVELIPLAGTATQSPGSTRAPKASVATAPGSKPAAAQAYSAGAPVSARAAGAQSRENSFSSDGSTSVHEPAFDVSDAELLAYRRRLEQHLARYRVYPVEARALGRQGVVLVHFSMTQDGKVVEAWVESSSGTGEIDAEALAALFRAQPLPALPTGWPAQLDVSLPVTFRLG